MHREGLLNQRVICFKDVVYFHRLEVVNHADVRDHISNERMKNKIGLKPVFRQIKSLMMLVDVVWWTRYDDVCQCTTTNTVWWWKCQFRFILFWISLYYYVYLLQVTTQLENGTELVLWRKYVSASPEGLLLKRGDIVRVVRPTRVSPTSKGGIKYVEIAKERPQDSELVLD